MQVIQISDIQCAFERFHSNVTVAGTGSAVTVPVTGSGGLLLFLSVLMAISQ
ncbi:hypothetical protein Patl1_26424 [Pistacia atlantica]|uniref:Uncharacterized protein n=1 Tax=Pistacia atlantica TaxID=434234 RepID=A0ACC1AYW7_9ROSI|nr:hypothetical protein Patl1_26424 [Pistacia atlantica]